MLVQIPTNNPEVDLATTYDAVIVGSGAAGGMAAHVLTSHGLKVLLLEAGKYQDTSKILHSMQWPYDHPRRGRMPSDIHALNLNEYNIRQSPYAQGSQFKKVESYVQRSSFSDYSKTLVVDEKENPYSGTRYAWVRSRIVGGKTNIWGRLALRLSNYDFKAKDHDGWGENWPISYEDIAPYYDRVDRLLGVSGFPEHLPQMPDGIFQRPVKLTYSELHMRQTLQTISRTLTPYRAGVATDGVKNKYRSRCYGRGACHRHVGGCDIHAAFDSPTGLIRPAMDTGNLTLRPNSTVFEVTVDKNTGKATGVSFLDSETHKSYQVKAKTVVLAASTLESARLLLLSKSSLYPNGLANSSEHVGHNFCEHIMGPSVSGFMPELVGKPRTLDDGKPGGFYIPRFRNLTTRQPDFIRGYGFEGGSGCGMIAPTAFSIAGFGEEYKKNVRTHAGAVISMGGFGEVLARYDNAVGIDPELKDAWGIPVLRFSYRFGENEFNMCKDMAKTAREMFEAAKFEVVHSSEQPLPEGWSIHEMGTSRMGNDPKTSVLNQFEQSHDVKNLFVVDGSSFVCASAQNPTWTIMALCWRSCDHLADQLQKQEI